MSLKKATLLLTVHRWKKGGNGPWSKPNRRLHDLGKGYNFEDAVIMSERLVKEDVYHICSLGRIRIRNTRYQVGPWEEITREISKRREDALRDLDGNRYYPYWC